MKVMDSAAVDQIESGHVTIAGAVKLAFGENYFLWSGAGELTLDADTFTGIGENALITPVASMIGGQANAVTATLGGLTPETAATIEAEDYHQKPAVLYRIIFGEDRFTVLDAVVYQRGRVDQVTIRHMIGGDAAIDMQIEGPARDMNRAGSRVRSDADQRVLGGATDGFFKRTAWAQHITLYLGGKPSTAASDRRQAPRTN